MLASSMSHFSIQGLSFFSAAKFSISSICHGGPIIDPPNLTPFAMKAKAVISGSLSSGAPTYTESVMLEYVAIYRNGSVDDDALFNTALVENLPG